MESKWPEPIDHTYILCDPAREPDRAAYLKQWLSDNHISTDCYTMGLSCYGTTITPAYAMSVYDPTRPRDPVPGEHKNFNRSNLKLGEISLVLNWAAAAKDAVAKRYGAVMILESDVLFSPTFLSDLRMSLSVLKTVPWDFLSLSEGPKLRPKRDAGDTRLAWFQVRHYYHTRTTDAMIFKVSMLEKILGTLFPFAEVLDWELNYQLTRHVSQSFWLDPPIIKQGSGTVYPTTL